MASTPNFAWPTPDDTDPVGDGALDMRTLGNSIDSTLGDQWTNYTPTLTQSATVTKTTYHARYKKIGKSVTVQIFLTVTGAGTASQIVAVGLPFTAKNNSAFIGSGFVYDASTNTMYNILPTADAGPTFTMFYQTGNNFGASPAVTLANTDQLRFSLSYEAA